MTDLKSITMLVALTLLGLWVHGCGDNSLPKTDECQTNADCPDGDVCTIIGVEEMYRVCLPE